jgi:hypothetical protein
MNRIALRLPPRLLVPLSRLLATAAVAALSACGGGGDGGSPPPPPPPPSAPTIVTQPAATTVLDAAPGSFSVVANGAAPLNFQWRRNGTDIAGATGATHNFTADFADNGAIYTAVVSNAAGSTTSNGATLNVTPRAPTITTQPESATRIVGDAVTFRVVVAGGTQPITYLWQRAGQGQVDDGPNVSGARTDTLRIVPTAADNGARFSVLVLNPAGRLESANATLTVRPAPDVTAPTIVGRSPAPGAIAPITTSVEVAFSEPVSPGLEFELRRGSATGAIVPTRVLVSADRRIFALIPTAALTTNATYTVRVARITDDSGNQSPDASWSFSTLPFLSLSPTPGDPLSRIAASTVIDALHADIASSARGAPALALAQFDGATPQRR